jgi:hypothetical protein
METINRHQILDNARGQGLEIPSSIVRESTPRPSGISTGQRARYAEEDGALLMTIREAPWDELGESLLYSR